MVRADAVREKRAELGLTETDVLAYPKVGLSKADQRELLGDCLPSCTVVRIPAKPPIVPPCRESFDLPFPHLATCGEASNLVTGDRDLLEITADTRFKILSAAEIIARIAWSSRPGIHPAGESAGRMSPTAQSSVDLIASICATAAVQSSSA